jgi:hypothetical protein
MSGVPMRELGAPASGVSALTDPYRRIIYRVPSGRADGRLKAHAEARARRSHGNLGSRSPCGRHHQGATERDLASGVSNLAVGTPSSCFAELPALPILRERPENAFAMMSFEQVVEGSPHKATAHAPAPGAWRHCDGVQFPKVGVDGIAARSRPDEAEDPMSVLCKPPSHWSVVQVPLPAVNLLAISHARRHQTSESLVPGCDVDLCDQPGIGRRCAPYKEIHGDSVATKLTHRRRSFYVTRSRSVRIASWSRGWLASGRCSRSSTTRPWRSFVYVHDLR